MKAKVLYENCKKNNVKPNIQYHDYYKKAGIEMYESLKIQHLRAIDELAIDNLGQINLFVGSNNCGKTTVLEAIFFLIGATNPHALPQANALRGLRYVNNELWSTYFHNMNIQTPIQISGVYRGKDFSNEHALTINIREKGGIKAKEVEKDVKILDNIGGENLPPRKMDGLNLFFKTGHKKNVASTIYLDNEDIKTEGTTKPFIDGYYISPQIQADWKETFDDIQKNRQIDDIVELVKDIEPHLTDLRLDRIGLLMADVGLTKLIPVNLMGGGLSRLLTIAIAMLTHKDGIVLIDEIENGLHYSAQDTLWKAIISWSEKLNVQVFATTHSYECIGSFARCSEGSLLPRKASLYRIEKTDKHFRTVRFDIDEIKTVFESNWEIR